MDSFYKRILKPLFDFVAAIISILLLSPLMIVIAIAIKIDSRGPVIFKQSRMGLKGKVFQIYKFRSMVSDQKQFGRVTKLYEDDPRITKVGRLMRKTSLDEIPQLFNIVKGDMSFIGPRPPLPDFPKRLSEYSLFERQRFNVKPGIGGLAQTRCREIHDWDINIPIDVEYTQNYGLIYDLKLFLLSMLFFFKTGNVYRKK